MAKISFLSAQWSTSALYASCFLSSSSKVLKICSTNALSVGLKETSAASFSLNDTIPVSNLISGIAIPPYAASGVKVIAPLAPTAAVPVVRLPPSVTSMGIPTEPPPSPPRLDGLTIDAS